MNGLGRTKVLLLVFPFESEEGEVVVLALFAYVICARLTIVELVLETGEPAGSMRCSSKLIDAKEHPDQYRGLVVRVSGYSAYFNDLTESMKDELIQRTAHDINSCSC